MDLSELELADLPSIFDLENEKKRSAWFFLREFMTEISRSKNGKDQKFYKPTQVFTKFIQRNTDLKGIRFKSSKTDGCCYVLFVINRDCLDVGDKIDSGKNQLIMETVKQEAFNMLEGNTSNQDMYQDFLKQYDSFVTILKKDMGNLMKVAGKDIVSIEATALLFSDCIVKDIATIEKLKANNYEHRYTDGIIRGICEQVIEFKYLYKNQSLLSEYYGINKTEAELNDLSNESNLFIAIKKLLGDKRYTHGRNIRKMARDIGEETGTDDEMSLYEAYIYYSTRYHNSYLDHLSDLIGETVDDDEEINDDQLDYIMLIIILDKYIEVYNKIVTPLS